MADAPAAAPETAAEPTTAAPAAADPGATPPAQGGAPAAPPAAPQTYKLTVNGQERTISEEQAQQITHAAAALGLSPQEFVQAAQLKAAAYGKFEEAARLRQETEQLLRGLKTGTREALRRAGIDPREFAQREIMAAIEEEQRAAEEQALPPNVRAALARAREQEQELQRLKAERQQASKGQMDAAAKSHFDRWNAEMPAALERAGLPRTVEASRLVANKMAAMHRAGMPIDLAFAAQAAAKELQSRDFALLSKMAPDRIIAAIGQDAYNALLRHSVAQANGSNGAQKPAAKPLAPREPGRRWLTEKEGTDFWTK